MRTVETYLYLMRIIDDIVNTDNIVSCHVNVYGEARNKYLIY